MKKYFRGNRFYRHAIQQTLQTVPAGYIQLPLLENKSKLKGTREQSHT
jgi:hypothetical protein